MQTPPLISPHHNLQPHRNPTLRLPVPAIDPAPTILPALAQTRAITIVPDRTHTFTATPGQNQKRCRLCARAKTAGLRFGSPGLGGGGGGGEDGGGGVEEVGVAAGVDGVEEGDGLGLVAAGGVGSAGGGDGEGCGGEVLAGEGGGGEGGGGEVGEDEGGAVAERRRGRRR